MAYDALIEHTRHRVETEHERPRGERTLRATVFSLFPYRNRPRALRVYQSSGGVLPGAPLEVAESSLPTLATMERAGSSVAVTHTARLLDASLRGLSVDQLLGPARPIRSGRSRPRRR